MTARNEPQASEPLGEVLAALKTTTEALERDGDPAFAHIVMDNRKIIAANEPAPVDPLIEVADDIWCALPSEWTRKTFVESVANTLRARLPAAAVAAIEGEK